MTVRLTPDGKEVTGVYYSAHRYVLASPLEGQGAKRVPHAVLQQGQRSVSQRDFQAVLAVPFRHRDGMWRSADEVPMSEDGRPLAYIAENGHGSYPIAGTILRLFCVINDYTSDQGGLMALSLSGSSTNCW